MRIIFFFAIISLVLLAILEEANSMPRGEAKEKKAVGALSPAKPKSPAKSKAKSPGKEKHAKGEAKAAEKEAKAHSKKDEKIAKNGEEKVSDSSPSKVSPHTDKDKKEAKSPAKKDKGPKSPVKSPKKEDKHKANLEIAQRAEAKSPTKAAQKGGKNSQMGGGEEAAEKAQAEVPKLLKNAKGAEAADNGNAIELAADVQQPSSSSLATSDPSSANEFGSFEPAIVAYSEFYDDDLDTSGSDFDLDFTDDEDELFSEDGNYFDFGDEWAEEGQFEGTEFVGNMPEMLVH
ncbi:hypothetical protein niasHT_022727 [Heterodera trifolii]|uniref:Uncharacterized protein n=1 Tax=Heterodera trifolii TaxID=157864 RepID=A0ABD2KMW1_9BILA